MSVHRNQASITNCTPKVVAKSIGFVLALAVLTAAIGCNPSASSTTDSSQSDSDQKSEDSKLASRGTIGVSVLTMSNPFFKVIADSITDEAQKSGFDVEVVSGEYDVAKQQTQVKDFIVKGVAAIVLCPCDSKAIGPVIQEANAAGVPVFTTDIACRAPNAKVICHVATDNYQGGKLAGQAMVDLLGEGGGEVAILDLATVESCIMRVKGFREVIDAHNSGREKGKIEVVTTLPCGGLKDIGYKAAEDAIQAHPNLAAVFTINDPAALGARAAVEKAGKVDQIRIIGFDGQPEAKVAIKEGKIYASPIQFPRRMGTETVQAIVSHLKGEELPAEKLIPTELYTKQTADTE